MLLTEIDHVAIAVHDLEAAIDYYRATFGCEVEHREVVESDGVEEALLKVADSYIQLLTPTRPDSPVAKALEKRGEGLHHIGYRVADCAAALDAVKREGHRVIDEAPRPGSRGTTVAFVHPKTAFGTLIELVQEQARDAMPVPFPPVDAPVKGPPDLEEVRVIAGAVAAAVAPPTGLTDLQRVLVEALLESMTGFPVPAGHVPRVGAEPFARALAPRNEAFRHRMVHLMLLAALVLRPLPEEVVVRVGEYAHELGVDDDMLRIAARYAHGSLGLALIDFQRSGYMQTWAPEHAEPLHTSRALTDAWEECVFDPDLALRWESLRELPDGTLGREVANFYDARAFVFPGMPGSAPPLLAQHDWVHVLAHYGSTVESELEVFAFIARANDDPAAFSLLAMVISLFETGYLASGAGLFRYDIGHLSHEGVPYRLADAMRRGALCGAYANGPDLLRIDWFAHAEKPVDDVRREFGIVAKSERALEAGSVGPWELGGISQFQFVAGQDAAKAAGRVYDSHGAVPD